MSKLPRHVSIIMDGNGRWAANLGQERLMGHKAGVESVREAVEYAAERGIEFLSLFAFSEENWNRPKNEIEGLMELMIDAIIGEKENLMSNQIKFLVIGERERLNDRLNSKISEMEELTSNNGRLTLVIFLSYSGKWDILQATQRYLNLVKENKISADKQIDSQFFASLLSTYPIPDPDLLIRTSGEQRISNFLLWQSAYSEFYFTDTLWPDFRKNDFELALEEYARRERRFGKTGDQINIIK